MNRFCTILFISLAVCFLAACKTDEEKRLDELYKYDNHEVAKAFVTGGFNLGKPYRDINAECSKEKMNKIKNGKWCSKFKLVEEEERKLSRITLDPPIKW